MSTLLAHVVRSGFVEGEHHGTAVALAADGSTVVALGDVDAPFLPRSSSKPLQAVGMLRAGLDLPPHLLALAAASHSGERYHRDGVRRILAGAGLDEQALQTPPALPFDPVEEQTFRRAGRAPAVVAHNCSGKHAAMLATCVVNGWSTADYRDPGHPLQKQIAHTLAELAGAPVAATAVDGCGAPLLAVPPTGLARAFARIATAPEGTPEHRVAAAVRTHPEWLGGTGRDVTALLRDVPGLVAKDGAEGVYAAALPDGRVAVVKVADGADRARGPVLAALLRRLGVEESALRSLAGPPLLGGGRPVGAIEVVGI